MKKYTIEDWKADGDLKLSIGQIVEDKVVEELRDCVPPMYVSRGVIQCGEPYSRCPFTGLNTYHTFMRTSQGEWKFIGDCPEYKKL